MSLHMRVGLIEAQTLKTLWVTQHLAPLLRQGDDLTCQGHSVFEFNTDESQRKHWLGSNRRQAAAMLVWPAHRNRPMAVLRNAAIMWGILPQRTCEPSSNVTSRTQCDLFSIPQSPLTSSNSRWGVARSGRRLVTPYTTSTRSFSVFWVITRRPTSNTCARPGQSPSPRTPRLS